MAAAYAALVSLFNTLELIQNHPRHSFSFDNNQIQSILESVSFLIDFMESYGDSHGTGKEAVEVLERQIAHAAHAAEEVIESHVVDQIRAGSTLRGKTTSSSHLDLNTVIEEMDFVMRKVIKAKKAGRGKEAAQPTYTTPLTSVENNTMVGFDGVLLQLMDMLTGEPSGRKVIPIVGMGGIGKTTLVENAFQNKSIVRHFHVHRWVTISQEYSVEQILLQLLSRQGKSAGETVGDLGEQLHKKLWGRRYLIVLDDVWSVEAWYRIQQFLPDDGNKSRIVMTTRLRSLADCFDSSSCLIVNFLDEDQSWNLFCERAFAKEGCPRELEHIGKVIVKKCKGLPLAIVVVGGHLRMSSRTREYWENVANSINSILRSGYKEEELFNMLSLSYNHLPIHLKPCFLYMGTFREDGAVGVSKLVTLWTAEGFLKPNKAQSSEEIAMGYIKDLIARNLVLISRSSLIYGEDGNCKIHDVLRELCLKIAEKEKFFHLLHISRARNKEPEAVINERNHALRSAPRVRSLKRQDGQQPLDLKLLRVLENTVDKALMMRNEVDGGFLEANFQQVNLRYLQCLKVDMKYRSLPSLHLSPSISLLWNLQTIIVRGFYPLVIAPHEIWEMVQLKHFSFRRISLPHPLPNDHLVLRNLHTLSTPLDLKLSEEVCTRIPHIKDLQLEYHSLEKACDEARWSYYCPNNLGRFHKLESLHCSFSEEPEWHDFALSLTLPTSLKKLSLSDSRLDWEEMTMAVGSLPHLEVLRLNANSAVGSEWNPVEGKFPRLKSLFISGCDDLIYWNAEKSHFPVLEKVTLQDLSRLDEFPSSVGDIPTIRYVALRRCSVSSAVSAMKMLVEQEQDLGNDGIQLEVTFSGDDEKMQSFWEKMKEDDLRSDNLRFSPH